MKKVTFDTNNTPKNDMPNPTSPARHLVQTIGLGEHTVFAVKRVNILRPTANLNANTPTADPGIVRLNWNIAE